MVLNPVSTTDSYGMAGNVVANLRSLGAEAKSLSPELTIIKRRYRDKATGYLITRVDENDQCARVDPNLLRDYLEQEKWAAILVSDYDKGFLTENDMAEIARHGRERGIPTLLDTKKVLGPWSRHFTYVKINEREYQIQLKAGVKHPEEYCQNLIVTMGDKGSRWLMGGELAGKVGETEMLVEPIAVADVSGAGDTWAAAFTIMAVKTGGDVPNSMDYANRAARIAVSKRGVVAVKASEV